MSNYLVTGGAGFIGSHIVHRLVNEGHTVTVVDNLCAGFESNLAAVREQIHFVQAEICDTETLVTLLDDIDCIFHLAALASVHLSIEDPAAVNRACVDGTLSVLQAAQTSGVRRVVYSASSACYGDQPFSANRETDLAKPMSPYAVAKLAGEYYCQAFFHTYGLETVSLRYFNVFGPRQDPNSHYAAVIPIFISRILNGKPPIVFGDGLQSRDFTYVENVVDANLLAATVPEAAGKTFNIAGGRSITLLDLIGKLSQLLEKPIKPIHEAARQGEIRDSMADISLANQVLGFAPNVDFASGLERSIDYYRELAEKQTASAEQRAAQSTD